MNPRNKRVIMVVLLIIAIANYIRIPSTEHIRNIEFISIFTIGMLSGLLLRELAVILRNKWIV